MTSMPPATAPKKSKMPGIFLGCGCLSLLIAIGCLTAAYFMKGSSMPSGFSDLVKKTTETSTDTTAEGEAPMPMKTYVNSAEGRSGNLAENFVDFHFQYPESWTLKQDTSSGAVNFVTVERGSEGKTFENFNVGYFQSTGVSAGDQVIYPQLIQQIQQQFSGQFPGLQKISEGSTHVAAYDGYQGLFKSSVKAPDGQNVDIFIRPILIPNPDGGRKGVTIIMLGTSFAPELSSAEDLGEKGELPWVMKSFRFGKE